MATRWQESRGLQGVITHNVDIGAAVGIGAYVAGYVVTFLLTLVDGLSNTGDVATWRVVGWVFYGVHNVKMESTVRVNGVAAAETKHTGAFEALAGNGLTETVPGLVYRLVPVVLLLVAGVLVYRRAWEENLSPLGGAALGGLVFVGYLLCAVGGAVLFKQTVNQAPLGGGSGDVMLTIGPAMAGSVGLVGLAYPVVCGAIGGLVGNQLEI